MKLFLCCNLYAGHPKDSCRLLALLNVLFPVPFYLFRLICVRRVTQPKNPSFVFFEGGKNAQAQQSSGEIMKQAIAAQIFLWESALLLFLSLMISERGLSDY
jgi:hypothetical protein